VYDRIRKLPEAADIEPAVADVLLDVLVKTPHPGRWGDGELAAIDALIEMSRERYPIAGYRIPPGRNGVDTVNSDQKPPFPPRNGSGRP
jgi:hypothetical protein